MSEFGRPDCYNHLSHVRGFDWISQTLQNCNIDTSYTHMGITVINKKQRQKFDVEPWSDCKSKFLLKFIKIWKIHWGATCRSMNVNVAFTSILPPLPPTPTPHPQPPSSKHQTKNRQKTFIVLLPMPLANGDSYAHYGASNLNHHMADVCIIKCKKKSFIWYTQTIRTIV